MNGIQKIEFIETDPERFIGDKYIYPTLLEPGLHRIELDALESKILFPFEDKRTRTYLCNRFRELVNELKQYSIDLIIWIDGSCCSLKPHPSDLDLVIFLDKKQVNSLPQKIKTKLLDFLNNRDLIRARYGCDLFFRDKDDEKEHFYWQGLFSLNQLKEAKGFLQLRIFANANSHS
ncbi:hypothetical protein AY606_10130 [Acinetobacter sp. SFB]|uniref:DUF6932 family protein n=1 Tax=Acinetobacter sp. SFB TaxID=1805634 RepID=UPI0007D7DDE9|nr:hypothetical protein [Acinetobacter sp. SFB]OAL77800.1 hypothetical protein AY606_10130 [Acinetobacter sp. SFB]